MAIQRNAIVAPFSVNSPLLEGGAPEMKKSGAKSSPAVVAITHQKWFTQVQQGINASVQISSEIPATSTSPGQPGTIVPFAGGFYFCVGSNSWLKFLGAPF